MRKKLDKQDLLCDLADHVLEHGLSGASLRPLAAAANTSDRMLIYHFGSKDGLIAELLGFLAARIEANLNLAIPPVRFTSEHLLLQEVLGMMRMDASLPYTRVWLDIISTAARGGLAHQQAGGAIVQVFLDWIAVRHPHGAAGAPLALALIEGCLVLDAAGHRAVADAGIRSLAD